MKTVEPQFTLDDDLWIWANPTTGRCAIGTREELGRLYGRTYLPVSIAIGSSARISPKFKPGKLNKLMAEVWALTVRGVNPQRLHNELLKVAEYRDQVCPHDMLQERPTWSMWSGERPDIDNELAPKAITLDELPQAPKGHFERKPGSTGTDVSWDE